MTITATLTATPIRDFLTDVLDDAAAHREPDGYCSDCIKSDTNRCRECQADQDRAVEYMSILDAVEAAEDDTAAVAAFMAGLMAKAAGS